MVHDRQWTRVPPGARLRDLADSDFADLVIRNARLWTGQGTVTDSALGAIKQGRIVAVQDQAKGTAGRWHSEREINAQGGTLLPG